MLANTESKKKDKNKADALFFGIMMKKETQKELITYLIIIVVVILIRTFLVSPVRVNGSSMDSTLKEGEIMILNKIKYKFSDIKRFDIVVVKTESDRIIKRVIGLPGETLRYENNILYINNKEVKEPYLKEATDDFNITELAYDVIPETCYFVIGDNRDNSLDSRYIGCIDNKDIVGNAKLILFPFKNFGYVK